MNDEILDKHIESASESAFYSIREYADRHELSRWTMLINTVCVRMLYQVAARCRDIEEAERIAELCASTLGKGFDAAFLGKGFDAANLKNLARSGTD